MEQALREIGTYLAAQGPWAVMCGALGFAAYKLLNRLIAALERNSQAFGRVEKVMERVIDKL